MTSKSMNSKDKRLLRDRLPYILLNKPQYQCYKQTHQLIMME